MYRGVSWDEGRNAKYLEGREWLLRRQLSRHKDDKAVYTEDRISVNDSRNIKYEYHFQQPKT